MKPPRHPRHPRLTTLLLAAGLAQALLADTPAPPATQLCQPLQLISAEKFDRADSFTPSKDPGTNGWRGGIGVWSIVNGAAYAVQEGPSKNRPNGHEAVCEHIVDLGDLVLTGEFKLGASPQVGFVCRDTNQPNLHLGRVFITPTAIWIQKMSGIAKETRREELARLEVQLDPEAWHRIIVEICGDRWLARIGDHVLEAQHERFQDHKGRVGMVARREGAQFRHLALWSAKPKSLSVAAHASPPTLSQQSEPAMSHASALTAYTEALNTHSWEKIAPHVAEDAVFIFTEGTFTGHAAAKAAFEKTFALIQDEQFSLHEIAWTAVTDDVASCHYEFRWRGLIHGQEASGGGRGTTILRKVDSRWLIAHEHLGPYPRKS